VIFEPEAAEHVLAMTAPYAQQFLTQGQPVPDVVRWLHNGALASRKFGSLRVTPVHAVECGPRLVQGSEMSATAELLPLDEVARRLHSSTSTVKRLIRAGQLRSVKLLGATRVHTQDLDTYLDSFLEPSHTNPPEAA
jgi:excisionase family DNA binding protein